MARRCPRRGPPQTSAGMRTPADGTAWRAEIGEPPMPPAPARPVGRPALRERQRRTKDRGKALPVPPREAKRPMLGAGAKMETGKPPSPEGIGAPTEARGGKAPPGSTAQRAAGVQNPRKEEAGTPAGGGPTRPGPARPVRLGRSDSARSDSARSDSARLDSARPDSARSYSAGSTRPAPLGRRSGCCAVAGPTRPARLGRLNSARCGSARSNWARCDPAGSFRSGSTWLSRSRRPRHQDGRFQDGPMGGPIALYGRAVPLLGASWSEPFLQLSEGPKRAPIRPKRAPRRLQDGPMRVP